MLTESLEAEDLQAPLTPRLRTAQHPQFFSMPMQWLYLSWGVTIIGGDEKEKERWEEEEILPWIWGEKGGKREWKRRVMRERGREREREREELLKLFAVGDCRHHHHHHRSVYKKNFSTTFCVGDDSLSHAQLNLLKLPKTQLLGI